MQCRACTTFNCNKATDMNFTIPTDGKTLFDYFNACTQLQARNDDDLPKFLCIKCTQRLRQAYSFRQEAHAAYKELKRILLESPKKDELHILSFDPREQLKAVQDVEYTTTFPDLLTVESQKTKSSLGSPNTLVVISPSEHTPDNGVCKIEESTFSSDQKLLPKQCLVVVPTKKEETASINEQYEALEDVDPLSIPGPTKKQFATEETTSPIGLQISINKKPLKTESFFDNLEESIETQFDDNLNTKKRAYKNKDQNFGMENLRKIHKCDHCDYKSVTKYVLKKHIFEDHAEDIVCRECSKAFDWPTEINIHKQLVHNTDKNIGCPWCKQLKALPPKDLSKHIQTKHKRNYYKYYPRAGMAGRGVEDPLQCELCNQFFISALELVVHTQNHTFECSKCGMIFQKSEAYKKHLRRKHEVSIQMAEKCALCSKYFNTKQRLRSHMKRIHNQADIGDTQNDSINSKVSLPEDSGDDEARKISATSSSKKTKKDTPRTAIKRENGSDDELVECKYCHKSIPTSKIKHHEKRHYYRSKREGKHICSYCSREFNYQDAVKSHERNIHLRQESDIKECLICHKTLNAKYLKHHMTTVHTEEKNFVCDVCGDRFKNNSLLSNHKQLHLDRKFPCTLCNKKYICASELKVHMRFHTGEEPFACHLCDRRFKVKVKLTYHLQQHAGIKRKCNVCGKEFNQIKHLKIHSYKHTGMPYRCPVCKYGVYHRSVFRRHLLRMHDMTITDEECRVMFKANTGRNPNVKPLEELQSQIEDGTDFLNI